MPCKYVGFFPNLEENPDVPAASQIMFAVPVVLKIENPSMPRIDVCNEPNGMSKIQLIFDTAHC